MTRILSALAAGCFLLSTAFSGSADAGESKPLGGWLSWRGPHQDGTSPETNLPEKWDAKPESILWSAPLPGQSTPIVTSDGKLYIMAYLGEGPDLQEGIFCLNATSGAPLWDAKFNDFLSDIIYTRYASSAPCVDPDTGNVYMQGSQGHLIAYTADGKQLWHHSMMEEYGRLTFPNGRTSSPVIDGELVITTGITANWGAHGPAGHRFYAFDKKTGELVWASQPGERPKDSCFSMPVFGKYMNQRVLWCGGGDGSVYCMNSQTGQPLWRYQASQGGVNACVLSYRDTVVAIHGSENIDAADIGRMIAIKPPAEVKPQGEKPQVLAKADELWRNNLSAFTASPILVGNRIYEVDETADLNCVDADTGKILWKQDLGIEQRTSSFLYADGRLYIPVLGGENGIFYIIKPGTDGCEILSKATLEGKCFGSPTVVNGRIYVQTTQKLYCFGKPDAPPTPIAATAKPVIEPGPLAKLLVIPSEVFLKPGETAKFRVVGVDANGNWLDAKAVDLAAAKWDKYIPLTAKVKAMLNGAFTPEGFKADAALVPSAGAVKVDIGAVSGVARGRIMPDLPISEDFEKAVLLPSETDPNVKFAFPPLAWIGARFKWEVHEKDGNKVFQKTIENKLFQRAVTFIGHPEMSNYICQADVMSDAVVRKVGGKEKIVKMSEVGVINHRYAIILKGSFQQLEVNSNSERVAFAVPFEFKASTWYTLKTHVAIDPATGEGTIRAKAWKKGEPEPEKWTLEHKHKTAHKNGSPGIFGFTPTDMPVYVDNVIVTPFKN